MATSRPRPEAKPARMSGQAPNRSARGASERVSETEPKGGRVVKSRYLQCFQKDGEKTSTAKTSAATKPRSVPWKRGASAGCVPGSLNQSSFEKGDLQSTLLDEDKGSRPELDLPAVTDRSACEETHHSKPVCKGATGTRKSRAKKKGNDDDVIEELESLTLLLTYLRIKAEKNLAELEKKTEENLLRLCEEKERQQEKLWELKREILLKEREQRLEEALDKQMDVLSPLVAVCEQFKEQYKNFATSLDAARHKLPIRNIHIEGDAQTYLDGLQKELTVTQELLAEIMPCYSEESAQVFGVLKDLKEVSQKLDQEIQRSSTQVQNLAFEVSKEVSLCNQRKCEEQHGPDVVRDWYFG
ncbi:HAUS augmin-like complex subunit 8 [Colius striatus]|uniref:HAUS augmin-like complex subunit 8 n=1 Tax=Colius striatus TaxID=57412 RepID=UPI002B1D3560|nr:HAUS augmin-like complex subunit 8 [Colius striatus]